MEKLPVNYWPVNMICIDSEDYLAPLGAAVKRPARF
jgi:hypothetical protein